MPGAGKRTTSTYSSLLVSSPGKRRILVVSKRTSNSKRSSSGPSELLTHHRGSEGTAVVPERENIEGRHDVDLCTEPSELLEGKLLLVSMAIGRLDIVLHH